MKMLLNDNREKQSYSITFFFSSKEHDLQTEKGITDITENKWELKLNEQRVRENLVYRLCRRNERL